MLFSQRRGKSVHPVDRYGQRHECVASYVMFPLILSLATAEDEQTCDADSFQ